MNEDFIVNIAVTVLLSVIKNKAKAAKLKAALLKVRNAISTQFPGE